MGPNISTIHSFYPLLSWFAVRICFHTHQTNHFSIVCLEFDFNTPFCFSFFFYFFLLKLSFGNQQRFFSLILSLAFPSPALVFQKCQLNLFSFFLFSFSLLLRCSFGVSLDQCRGQMQCQVCEVWIHSF